MRCFYSHAEVLVAFTIPESGGRGPWRQSITEIHGWSGKTFKQ